MHRYSRIILNRRGFSVKNRNGNRSLSIQLEGIMFLPAEELISCRRWSLETQIRMTSIDLKGNSQTSICLLFLLLWIERTEKMLG